MILCVNLNAAIDKTVIVPGFRLNEIHRPQQVMLLPGGKGCNVARALRCLGEQPVVTGWVGGYAGQFIQAGLAREGIGAQLVQHPSESRTCLSILDPDGHTLTELYEQGEVIPEQQVQELLDRFERDIAQYAVVTLSGSLPPGVPSDFYSTLIGIAKRAGVPTLLDTIGEALIKGIAGGPTCIKPNKNEFEEWVGAPVQTSTDCATLASALSKRHETIVVVSLGAEGLLCGQAGRVIRAVPPKVDIVSPVGSGDALLAGIAYGFVHAFALEESLRYGVAAGTANALTVGAGVFARADFDALLARVMLDVVPC